MKGYNVPLQIFRYNQYKLYTDEELLRAQQACITEVLSDYQIDGRISSLSLGPTVTTFNISIERHVSPKRVVSLKDEFAERLEKNVRCYPNYEEGVISIEVPNERRSFLELGEMLANSSLWEGEETALKVAMGKDNKNCDVVIDLRKMIHVLIGGLSGSGKTCFLNSMIMSLMAQHSPQELQFLLLDLPATDFNAYCDAPHLITGNPISGIENCVKALSWVIAEMNRRYYLMEKMSRAGTYAVNVDQYNLAAKTIEGAWEQLPKIVVVIDELADLMLANKAETESRLQTILQKSRAAGIHVVAASKYTRPDVMSGLIKYGFATRIAFRVDTDVDSRVVLDCSGAEELLGKGDYHYVMPGVSFIVRMQAPYVSTEIIQEAVAYVREHYNVAHDEEIEKFMEPSKIKTVAAKKTAPKGALSEIDPLYIEALRKTIEWGQVSISMIQRKCQVGYNRAGKILEWMEDMGYITAFTGNKARMVLITMEEFERIFVQKADAEHIKALKFAIENKGVSVAILQRRLGMALETAVSAVEWMEKSGYVAGFNGKNPRNVLLSMEEFKKIFEE